MGAAVVQDDGRIDDTSAESDEADSRSRSLHSDSESEAASGDDSNSGQQRLSIRTGAAHWPQCDRSGNVCLGCRCVSSAMRTYCCKTSLSFSGYVRLSLAVLA